VTKFYLAVTPVEFKILTTVGKRKAIPVTGREDPYGCGVEAPTFSLDNRITDGGKGVGLTLRPPFSPQKDSWCSSLKAE
jgi:hypothetical protein